MPTGEERRKGLRAVVPIEFYFNLLNSREEYVRGHTSVLKRLSYIDSIKPPPTRTESQILLARIDQKLSILVSLLADKSSRKSYAEHGVVNDISESGLSFSHFMALENGAVLEIGLQLPMGEHTRLMDIAGVVVQAKKSAADSQESAGPISTHTYGVEFFDIQGKDQNDIIQWIFTHQREQIRKRREKERYY